MDSSGPSTRREVLRTLAAAASAPVVAGAVAALRRIGIVGAGMAGVSLAWLLDGSREVVMFEAQKSIGGNVQSLDVELDGHSFVVDMGAQVFHPGPYPVYTALLTALGLYSPGSHHAEPIAFVSRVHYSRGRGRDDAALRITGSSGARVARACAVEPVGRPSAWRSVSACRRPAGRGCFGPAKAGSYVHSGTGVGPALAAHRQL